MNQAARSFQELQVWQRAHELVLGIYKMSRGFPSHEQYGLTSQLRRSAVSVPANIAEGFKKMGKPDKARFLNIAQASLEETRYYLILSRDLNYANPSELMALADEVSRMLDGYYKAILSSIS